jgi:lysozyme
MSLSADDPLLKKHLIQDEGLKAFPYVDTAGKTTIGIGRNLTDVGLSTTEIAFLYNSDVIRAITNLTLKLPWWRNLDNIRQIVMVNLCFNMGIATLLTFTTFLQLMQAMNYQAAATDLAGTAWHKQVGQRAIRLETMLRTGQDV